MTQIINDSFIMDGSYLNEKGIKAAKEQHKMTAGTLFEKTVNEFGQPVLKKVSDNSVVFGGAVIALEKLCGVPAKFKPATLNEIYDIPVTGTTGNETIALFGCGTGGSGLDFTSVIKPSLKWRNIPDQIPLRYGATLAGEEAGKYFLKKSNASDPGTFSWYLKEFDNQPVVSSYWKNAISADGDGSEITSEIYASDSEEGIETLAEFHFSLNQYDVREYFEATSDLDYARYNTFGFYLGEKVGNEYGNVRLFSAVTFKNRDVSIETSASYVYRVYALI